MIIRIRGDARKPRRAVEAIAEGSEVARTIYGIVGYKPAAHDAKFYRQKWDQHIGVRHKQRKRSRFLKASTDPFDLF